jgi:hypothetical protein
MRDAEISQFDAPAVGDEQIVGFYIAMHYSV